MKKRILCLFLALCMLTSILPATALAEDAQSDPPQETADVSPDATEELPGDDVADPIATSANFNDADVTWLGPLSEHSAMLAGMYDNGLRRVQVGEPSASGLKNIKWGMVDTSGNFVVPPIYDSFAVPGTSGPVQKTFTGGYCVVSRGGKQGLINTLGQEVIPAQYHAVGFPSEGLCRVIIKSGDSYLLGYWNLAEGRERIKPQYPISEKDATTLGVQMKRKLLDPSGALVDVGAQVQAVEDSNADSMARYDFQDGYAFVPTSRERAGGAGIGWCSQGTIIDKNGKNILKGGPYYYRDESYPQFGPYMVFCKMSTKDFFHSEFNTNLGKAWESGVVGPEGIVLPAKYTGGIRVTQNGAFISDSRITVFPKLNLITLAQDMAPGKEDGGKTGAVNLKGKVVIPFTHDYNFFSYIASHNVFEAMNKQGDGPFTLYTPSGKKLHTTFEYTPLTYKNGYVSIIKALPKSKDPGDGVTFVHGFVQVATGKEWVPDVTRYAKGSAHLSVNSSFSTDGTIWLKSEAGLWGLYKFGGQELIPPKYATIKTSDLWAKKGNPVASVEENNKVGLVDGNGRFILPPTYRSIARSGRSRYWAVWDEQKKIGYYDTVTKKEIIKPQFDNIGIMHNDHSFFEYGAQAVRVEGDGGINSKIRFIDLSGNYVSDVYQYMAEAVDGYYVCTVTPHYVVGLDGKLLFGEEVAANPNTPRKSMAIVVKDGKVGYISTSRLAKSMQPKTGAALNVTAKPSSTSYMLNGKTISVDSYTIAGNNYIKLRDMAALINGSDKNFNVVWDNARGAINMTSGKAYAPVGKELTKGDGKAKAAALSTAPLYMNGQRVHLGAYTIGGNNYFKLRDIMKLFDVGVGYENSTATLETAKSYTMTAEELKSFVPYPTQTMAGYVPPPPKKVLKEPVIKFISTPKKSIYKVGEAFSSTGFSAYYVDVYNKASDISSEFTFKSGKYDLYEGYIWKSVGKKTISCYRKGKVENTFKVTITK